MIDFTANQILINGLNYWKSAIKICELVENNEYQSHEKGSTRQLEAHPHNSTLIN